MTRAWKLIGLLGLCCYCGLTAASFGEQKHETAAAFNPKVAPSFVVDDPEAAEDAVRTAQGTQCPAAPAPGDCCAPAGLAGPGCQISACCEAVCDVDPFCCQVLWDPSCANIASSQFGSICCDTCPGSCSGDTCCISQSNTKAGTFTIVRCAATAQPAPDLILLTTEQGFGRCFNVGTDLGINEPITIDSVKFGLRRIYVTEGGCEIPMNINFYTIAAPGACGAGVIPFASATLLASVPAGPFTTADRRRIVTVPIPGGVVVPAGASLMVELELPLDGTDGPLFYELTPMATNTAAEQCARSYLRAADCGTPDWSRSDVVTAAAPERGFVLEVAAHRAGGAPVVCGDGVAAGCEDCDDGNTTCGDGCDSNCQAEPFGICGDGVAACTEQCDGFSPTNPTYGEICSPTCEISQLCGDGQITGSEGCEPCSGASTCPANFACVDCQCMPPVCGDNVVNQASEECDGSDTGICNGGACDTDCTCFNQDDCVAESLPTSPPNDCCVNRLPIFDGLTPFTNVDANTDGGASPTGACNDGGFTQTTNDIWYNYTATCTGTLTVTTCENSGGSATYDTDIVLYAGCDDCPPYDLDGLDVIGCNDDSPEDPCGTVDFHSTASASVCQGQCIKIRVGGFGFDTDEGTGTINVVCEADPCVATGAPNDCCDASIPISNGDTPYDSTGANTDGAPSPAGLCNDFGSNQTYHDLWYDYTASCDGTVTVSTCEDTGGSANYDTDLVVYEGSDCCNLGFLACNDDDPNNACGQNLFHSTLSFNAVAGGVYKIRVGGWGPSDEGSAVLNVSEVCTPTGVSYALDIRSGKCPNKFKLTNSGGEEKVYIAGDADSDVHLINPDSIRLRLCGGADSIPWSKEPRFKDKVTPLETACGDCTCHKKKKDYIDDIELKFSRAAISGLIGDVPSGTVVEIEVFGELTDGTPFVAHDCVVVQRPNSYDP